MSEPISVHIGALFTKSETDLGPISVDPSTCTFNTCDRRLMHCGTYVSAADYREGLKRIEAMAREGAMAAALLMRGE